MGLDELLAKNADAVKRNPPVKTEDCQISKGQFNYLMGLARDYLPDGHSKQYSQADIMQDALLEYRNNVQHPGAVSDFRKLTMREAAKMIDWLKGETGK